jgi:hypothetical protein
MIRFLALTLTVLLVAPSPQQHELTEIDPAQLAQDGDLIGRAVAVDGRVEGLTRFNRGAGFNDLRLIRAPQVSFRLPAKFATAKPMQYQAVRLEGILRREGAGLAFFVTDLREFPDDLTRLDQQVRALAETDITGRARLAGWARSRAIQYNDTVLARRARELEGEAIRLEATRPSVSPPERWIELARKARSNAVPEPVPSALAHRALRAKLASPSASAELESLVSTARELLPHAGSAPAPRVDVSSWQGRYAADPFQAYIDAPAEVRSGLDRLLLADLDERWLLARSATPGADPLALATEARQKLPDRPQLARKLEEEGLAAAQNRLETLTRPAIEGLAQLLRDRREDQRAEGLVKSWLRARRLGLPPRDAEGRLSLASLYVEMVADKLAAAELLQEALALAPDYARAKDELRRLGYRFVGGRWVGSSSSSSVSTTTPAEAPAVVGSRGLLDLTRDEVREKMGGEPERVVRSASQGRTIEQWIYPGLQATQYLNFIIDSPTSPARVIGHFSIPRRSQ